MNAKKAEVLYPVTEVAEMWRCSDDQIYRLIAAGRLRSVDIGIGAAKTRIPESALAEFVAKNKNARKEKRAA